jgi:hypothetical protein
MQDHFGGRASTSSSVVERRAPGLGFCLIATLPKVVGALEPSLTDAQESLLGPIEADVVGARPQYFTLQFMLQLVQIRFADDWASLFVDEHATGVTVLVRKIR